MHLLVLLTPSKDLLSYALSYTSTGEIRALSHN